MIKIAILGHGVVGSGVVDVLNQNKLHIAQKAGREIIIKYILDLRDFDLPYSNIFVKDFNLILSDPEIAVVVETMGGLHPAYDFSKAALLAGKSVITSNKEVVAEKGAELLEIAQKNNVNYLFEASVGGGIPIIRPLDQCLAANNVSEVVGILNGTTNYILTKMLNDGADFESALLEAQEKGYAEKDPSADVDGLDACRKICILASLAFGRQVYPESIYTEGIRGITSADVEYAKKLGGVIKLIGKTKERQNGNGKIAAMVAPHIVPEKSLISKVDDVFNCIMVRGDVLGDVLFYGKGAGKMPTASAVVADVIDAVKHIGARKNIYWVDAGPEAVLEIDKLRNKFLLRFKGGNVPERLQGGEKIDAGVPGEIGYLTEKITEAEYREIKGEKDFISGIRILL